MENQIDYEDDPDEVQESQIPRYDPPAWLTTDQLDTELWNAIADDAVGSTEDYEEFEDDLFFDDEDEYEDEAEMRRSTFSLLIMMRPQLGELLGGPVANA